MKINVQHSPKANNKAIIVPFSASQKKKVLASIAHKEGIAKSLLQHCSTSVGKTLVVSGKTAPTIYLLGLGEELSFKSITTAFRLLSSQHKSLLPAQVAISWLYENTHPQNRVAKLMVEAAINGLRLGIYDIGLYKTSEKEPHPLALKSSLVDIYCKKEQVTAFGNAGAKGLATADTQMSILNLVNAPGNKAQPADLGDWARHSGKAHGYKVRVLNEKQIAAKGLYALMAVNRGSEYPPRFIIAEYQPRIKSKKPLPKVGLVGKGVTFDTGGLSIKGHQNMHYMKSDMGGAAAVLGAIELCAKLQLRIHLIAIVPTTDNCVDALSVKPGDVINSYSGKTIEVIDTDAEGRLILADGLAYMEKNYQPDIMINLATLTGSSVRALGYQAAALFSNNDSLAEMLIDTGERVSERLWRMPLWDAYKGDIESDVADVKNFSGRPVAGAISAAKFLESFINGHKNWAHLDIAGVAFGSTPFSSQKSATAFGVNLLVEFLRKLVKQ